MATDGRLSKSSKSASPFRIHILRAQSGSLRSLCVVCGVLLPFRRVKPVRLTIAVPLSGELKPALNNLQEVEFFPRNLLGTTFRYYFGSRKFMTQL